MKKGIGLALLCSMLAACGGGGSGSTAVPAAPSGGTGTLALNVKVPGANNAQVKALRRPLYTSRDTKGIGVEFKTASGGYSGAPATSTTGAPALQRAAAISVGAPGCSTSAASDGSFNCTIYVPSVPVGYSDFRVTLWNVTPGAAGSEFTAAGARALSTNTFPAQAIRSGQNNTYNFTLLPVVDNIAVFFTGGIVDGTSSSVTAYLLAKDAAGNAILTGDQYVNASGQNLTLAPALQNNLPAACAGAACSLTMTPAAPSFTNGGVLNSFTLSYNGQTQFPSSGATQPAIAVNITGGSIGGSVSGGPLGVTQTGGPVSVPPIPQVAQVSAAAQAPTSIAKDVKGNLWLAEGTKIEKWDGTTLTSFATPADPHPGGVPGNATVIVPGLDNYLWYVDSFNQEVVKFDPATGPSANPSWFMGPSIFTNATGVVFGPDGLVYIADKGTNQIYSVNPTTMLVVHSWGGLTANSNVSLMSVGPLLGPSQNKSVCFIEPNTTQGKVGCVDTTSAGPFIATEANTGATPSSIALGPDGLLYVGEKGRIESFNTSGGSLTITTGSGPYMLSNPSAVVSGMAIGRDNNLWFVEQSAASPTIGRVDIQSSVPHTVQEWNTGTGAAFQGGPRTPTGIVNGSGASFQLFFSDSQAGAFNLWSITP